MQRTFQIIALSFAALVVVVVLFYTFTGKPPNGQITTLLSVLMGSVIGKFALDGHLGTKKDELAEPKKEGQDAPKKEAKDDPGQ